MQLKFKWLNNTTNFPKYHKESSNITGNMEI